MYPTLEKTYNGNKDDLDFEMEDLEREHRNEQDEDEYFANQIYKSYSKNVN